MVPPADPYVTEAVQRLFKKSKTIEMKLYVCMTFRKYLTVSNNELKQQLSVTSHFQAYFTS